MRRHGRPNIGRAYADKRPLPVLQQGFEDVLVGQRKVDIGPQCTGSDKRRADERIPLFEQDMIALKIAGEQTGMVIAARPMLRTRWPTQSFCPIIPSIIDRRDEIRDTDDRSYFKPLLKSRKKSWIGDYDIGIQEHTVLAGALQRQFGLSVSRPIAVQAKCVKFNSLGWSS